MKYTAYYHVYCTTSTVRVQIIVSTVQYEQLIFRYRGRALYIGTYISLDSTVPFEFNQIYAIENILRLLFAEAGKDIFSLSLGTHGVQGYLPGYKQEHELKRNLLSMLDIKTVRFLIRICIAQLAICNYYTVLNDVIQLILGINSTVQHLVYKY